MIKPPSTPLSPCRPGLWITQTGYALDDYEMAQGVQQNFSRLRDMRATVDLTQGILRRMMK